jgi:tetratricopeptide (TPR) repeat protein
MSYRLVVRLVVGFMSASIAASTLLVFAPSARAEPVRVEATVSEEFGRIIFAWASPVGFQVTTADGRFVVRFDRPIEADFDDAVRRLAGYVGTAHPGADGRSVGFALQRPVTVMSYGVGSTVIVDLMDKEAASDAPVVAKAAADPATSGPPRIRVRTGEHDGFSRVVFDWPERVGYRIEKTGKTATVIFDRPARIDLGRFGRQRLQHVLDAEVKPRDGGSAVTLTLPGAAQVKHFRYGPKVVVDVLAVVAPDANQDLVPLAPTSERGPEAVADAPSIDLLPPDNKAAAPPTQSTASLPEKTLVEIPAEAAALMETAAPKDAAATTKTTQPPASVDRPHEAKAILPAAPRKDDTPQPAPAAETVSLRFDWDQPVAAAVFRRAGSLWTIFDAATTQDLAAFRTVGGGLIHTIERIPVERATVLRITTAEGINPRLRRDGLAWIFDFGRQPLAAREGIESQAQVTSPTDARLFLPVPEPGEPIVFTDPEVGDSLVIVPVVPLAHGVRRAHTYPQLRLLATAQGVAIQPLVDDLQVRSSREGIELSGEGKLSITPVPKATQAGSRVGITEGLDRAMDLAKWADEDLSAFTDRKRRLVLAAAQAADTAREGPRLELARFYLAHGFGAETLGVLKLIAEDRPGIETEAEFRTMRGVGNLLMGRFANAREDLLHESVEGIDEGVLWRIAASAAAGDVAREAGDIEHIVSIVPSYPKPLRLAVGPLLAETAIEHGHVNQAARLMEMLGVEDLDPMETAYLGYLQGRLLEANGDVDGAVAKWTELEHAPHRQARAKALLARSELLLKSNRISRAEAIEALEQLRFAWRGDKFEFGLLRRLGRLYVEEHMYPDGLRSLRQAATHFPEYPATAEVTREMARTFEDLYLGSLGEALPPMTAIALYDEFRELTPAGDKGNEMIRKLADRLVQLDLLPRAAALLEDQVRLRLGGVEKARVGARLALVHMLDRKPNQALAALQNSEESDLPEKLGAQRRHLRAQALAELDRRDLALAALEGDDGKDADLIRADIFWKDEDWIRSGIVLRRIIAASGVRPGTPLTEEQATQVLNLAVALTLAGNERSVAKVRRDYGEAMDATPHGEAFRLIANPGTADPSQFRTVANEVSEAEGFQTYLAAFRERLDQTPISAIN